MYIGVWTACMSVRVLDLLELELADSCELLCGCWELNLGPLKEQLSFLNH